MTNRISQILITSSDVKQQIANDDALILQIQKGITIITDAFSKGKKVLFCGNGGSAADAQHLAAEFSGRFYKDRSALKSEALHCNTSYITAVGNDYGYEYIYSRLIDGIGEEGDVLVGISTSGNSQNILNAFKKCRDKKITTIAFTGIKAGTIDEFSDLLIKVPSSDTPRIQESHITIGHIICEMVEENLFD
jgi:D-sedoheptulose 7-phosphate isomerase